MTTSAIATAAPPLETENLDGLRRAVADFGPEELWWSSGYLAGLAAAAGADAAPKAAVAPEPAEVWHVFFATETGNSRHVAELLAEQSRAAGLGVEVHDLRDYKPRALARVRRAAFVVATHGVGDPPDGSEAFFDYWFGDKAPRLDELRYSILALGDSSYADFCVMGARLDERLRVLGATPVADRVDCDVDFDDPASAWVARVVEEASAEAPATPPRPAQLRAVSTRPSHSRLNPFRAAVLADQPITGIGSSKSVHHVELDVEGAGFDYLPGDSLGVVSGNPPELVAALLDATGLDGDSEVVVSDRAMRLEDALRAEKEVTVLSKPFLEVVAAGHEVLGEVLADRDALMHYLRSRQVIDVIAEHRVDWTAQRLADALRRLTPRLYSIASSPDANPDEVHLTVGRVRYRAFGRNHWGSASTYLTAGHREIPVYLERNDHFRLPEDGDTPIVMIGAGTGVAPYRAFVEHRAEHGHGGDNWLIFGDRNVSSDFLYQLEWLRYRKQGLLARLDVAFSRDQADKVYVQHRIAEQRDELRRWLERGAHVYVCGDADHMAGDVHEALLGVLADGDGRSADAAEKLAALKAEGRYQRDVY